MPQLTQAEFEKVSHLLPKQTGHCRYDNFAFLNAIIYIFENGAKWRQLPPSYGNWNSIWRRFSRWNKEGIFEKVFRELQKDGLVNVKLSDFNKTGSKTGSKASTKLSSRTPTRKKR